MKIVAKKRIGKTQPGGTLNVSRADARALIALGHAELAPVAAAPTPEAQPIAKRAYRRRDMAADQTTNTAAPNPYVTLMNGGSVTAIETKDDGQA